MLVKLGCKLNMKWVNLAKLITLQYYWYGVYVRVYDSPEVLIIRPPASFCWLGSDQKLRYDLEWPKLYVFTE